MLLDNIAKKFTEQIKVAGVDEEAFSINPTKLVDWWNDSTDSLGNMLRIEDAGDAKNMAGNLFAAGSLAGGTVGYLGARSAQQKVKEINKRLQDLGDSSIKEKIKMLKYLDDSENPKSKLSDRFLSFMKGVHKDGKSTDAKTKDTKQK